MFSDNSDLISTLTELGINPNENEELLKEILASKSRSGELFE